MEKEFVKAFGGKWYATKLLGKGNFGKVYEIEREDFGVIYKSAMKVLSFPTDGSEIKSLLAEGLDNESISQYYQSMVKNVVKEFEILSILKGNSYIVSYEDHEVYEHEDGVGYDIFIRMELLSSLTDYMVENVLDTREVVKIGIDLCNALELCGANNIIHRDIKPDNIFCSKSGFYKLGDFGVARTLEKTQSELTITGTQNYMAPEVRNGQSYDARCDQYSLGIVLYRLCNRNRLPFMPVEGNINFSDKENSLVKRFSGEPLPAPVEADDELAAIILKACSFACEDRFSSPAEMKEALEVYYKKLNDGLNSKAVVLESVANEQEEENVSDVTDTMHNAPVIDKADETVGIVSGKMDEADETVSIVSGKIDKADETVSIASGKMDEADETVSIVSSKMDDADVTVSITGNKPQSVNKKSVKSKAEIEAEKKAIEDAKVKEQARMQFDANYQKALQGDISYQCMIAREYLYDTSKLGIKSTTEAIKWYEKAAGQKLAKNDYNSLKVRIAMYELGMIYYEGLEGSVNMEKAEKYFDSAASKGHAKSMYYYGLCLKNRGKTKEGDKWIKKSEKGDVDPVFFIHN